MTWNSPLPNLPSTLLGKFASIARAVTDAVYSCSMPGGLLSHAMWRVVNAWVLGHVAQIRVLIAALQEGTVRTRRSPGERKRAAVAAAAEMPDFVVPRYFAWLTTATQGRVPLPNAWLISLLEDPEMMALLAASPRLVRTMKPLCRAVGVQLPTFPKPVPPVGPPLGPPVAAAEAGTTRAAAGVRHVAGPRAGCGRAAGGIGRFARGDARFRK